MPTLKDQRAELAAEADQLRTKAKNNPGQFTATEANRAEQIVDQISDLDQKIARVGDATTALSGLADTPAAGEQTGLPGDHPSTLGGTSKGANDFALTRSTRFTKNVLKAFGAAGDVVGGPASRKQLVDSGRITAEIPEFGSGDFGEEAGGSITGLPRVGLSMLEIIPAQQVDKPMGSYLRQTVRESNAQTVPAGHRKPISRFRLAPVRWEMSTIAHLSEPVKTQWLDDYDGLESFFTSELLHGLDDALSTFILYGGQAESDGHTIPGLLNTEGVDTTEYDTSALRTVRAAIGQLEVTGVQPTHLVMSPQDWEQIEVEQDTIGHHLRRNAPESRANKHLWGLTVVTPPSMEPGRAIVGDLSTVQLLHRGSHQISWNAGMADTTDEWLESYAGGQYGDDFRMNDLFRENMVRFRDELRAALTIGSLKAYRYALIGEEASGALPSLRPDPYQDPEGDGEDGTGDPA